MGLRGYSVDYVGPHEQLEYLLHKVADHKSCVIQIGNSFFKKMEKHELPLFLDIKH
jgi:hypothetical protein